MSLTDLLGGSMKQQVIGMLAQKLGVNQQTATSAVNIALPLLLNGLNKNTATPEGAEALHQTIQAKHDGSILDNLSSLIHSPDASQEQDSNGILKHILGSNQDAAHSVIGSASGIDANQSQQVLQMLAPVLLGSLGKQQQAENNDPSALAGLLQQTSQTQQAQAPDLGNLLSQFMGGAANSDSNQDSGGANDLGGLLGNLLK